MLARLKRLSKSNFFGNSVLFINAKFWTCGYCGNLLKDNTPFEITRINGNPTPYIFCSASCKKTQIVKLEAKGHEGV
jgi:hypothetical protein